MKLKIAVLSGDGVGPEVCAQAVKVLKAIEVKFKHKFTFTEGLRVFREQTAPSEPPYRTLRWGRHLQVWFLEGRDFRSTTEADRKQTPTILGPTQIAWLERTLTASDATFRVVITPTPMVGPGCSARPGRWPGV